MRAAKRKWFNRTNRFLQIRRKEGEAAAIAYLEQFDRLKVMKYVFKES